MRRRGAMPRDEDGFLVYATGSAGAGSHVCVRAVDSSQFEEHLLIHQFGEQAVLGGIPWLASSQTFTVV